MAAALRQKFLPYFTEGLLVGNCLLTAPSPGVRLAGYVRPDRVLAIVLNQGAEGDLTFGYDVDGWLNGASSTAYALTNRAGKRSFKTFPPPARSAPGSLSRWK